MLGSSSLSNRLRGTLSSEPNVKPSWFNSQVTPVLQSLSRCACTHPIHTLVFVGLLASTTYIGLLEGSLFGQVGEAGAVSSRTDWDALIEGSKTLCVGESTGWKWRSEEEGRCMESGMVCLLHTRLFNLKTSFVLIMVLAIATFGPPDSCIPGFALCQATTECSCPASNSSSRKLPGSSLAFDVKSTFSIFSRFDSGFFDPLFGCTRLSIHPAGTAKCSSNQ